METRFWTPPTWKSMIPCAFSKSSWSQKGAFTYIDEDSLDTRSSYRRSLDIAWVDCIHQFRSFFGGSSQSNPEGWEAETRLCITFTQELRCVKAPVQEPVKLEPADVADNIVTRASNINKKNHLAKIEPGKAIPFASRSLVKNFPFMWPNLPFNLHPASGFANC